MAQMTITPGNIEFGPCQVTFNGVDLGASKGGVTARYEIGWYDITIDQSTLLVDNKIQSERFTVTVPMAETDISTLSNVMPMGTKTESGSQVKIEFGGKQVSSNDAAELILTPLSDGAFTLDTDANKKITVHKAFPRIQFEKAYSLDGERIVPVEFHALMDTSKEAGKQLFVLGDTSVT